MSFIFASLKPLRMLAIANSQQSVEKQAQRGSARGRARLSQRAGDVLSSRSALDRYIRKVVVFAQIFEGGKGTRASARFTTRSQDCADLAAPFVREAKRAEAPRSFACGRRAGTDAPYLRGSDLHLELLAALQ